VDREARELNLAIAPAKPSTVLQELDTLPKLLLRNALFHPDRPAVRHKLFGIWQTWTWARLSSEVRDLSIGLSNSGLKRNDAVAIIGHNRPYLYAAIMAAQCLGAVPVPLNPDASSEELADQLKRIRAVIAIVQDQEQVDKINDARHRLPDLDLIIFESERGLERYDRRSLKSLSEIQGTGRNMPRALSEGIWKEAIAKGSGSDTCVALFTAGTLDVPKAVSLTHESVIRVAEGCNSFDRMTSQDVLFAHLPMALADDFAVSVGQVLVAAASICCPENPDTVVENRREIGPTMFHALPQSFEAIASGVMARMQEANGIKRAIFDYFLEAARHSARLRQSGRRPSFANRLRHRMGDILIYAPLRDQIGLSRSRAVYAIGSAITPELLSFYRGIGVNLKTRYGLTEAGSCLTVQADHEVDPETVGRALPQFQIRIAESGEIEYRTSAASTGAGERQLASDPSPSEDGWMRTGDIGEIDKLGSLRVFGRIEDLGTLSSGVSFSPGQIERAVKSCPEVREAIALGRNRDFVALLIDIDTANVSSWCNQRGLGSKSQQELVSIPAVQARLRDRVRELNSSLPESLRIKRVAILPKNLDPDDGELTRTWKVRRSAIAARYAPLIDVLYSRHKECNLSIAVSSEGGGSGQMEIRIEIIEVAE
jgi:long-chain acyl-CoA synthetase